MLRILSLLVSLTVAITLIGATYFYEQTLLEDRREAAERNLREDVGRLAGRLEQRLNRHLSITRSLAAFVRTKPRVDPEEFTAFAAELVKGEVGVRSVQLAPNGIVTFVTNLQENQKALGLDLFGGGERREAYLSSIGSRDTVILGPIDLVQGGKAIVARHPIFLEAANGGEEFWGFATVLVDPVALFRDTGVSEGVPGLRLAIRGSEKDGKNAEIIFGDPKIFTNPTLEVPVTMLVGSWQIAAAWTNSASLDLEGPYPAVWGIGLSAAGLFAFLIYVVLMRPARLRADVDNATKVSRLSEARFADFAHSASDWLWEISRDFRVTYISDKVEEIVGIPASAQIGLSLSELFGADYFTDKWAEARQAIKDRKPVKNFVYTRRHQDGHLQFLSVSGIPVFDEDGEFAGFRGTGTDITEQKVALERAQLAEQRLRTAIDSLEDGFVLFDSEDRLSICNDRYREIFEETADLITEGITFEEIIRLSAERGQYPEAEGDMENWIAERVRVHREGNVSTELQLPNGRWIRVAERETPDGGIVGLRVDITQLKQAQQAAVAASDAKSQFLANMSHEIRTPLNAIIGLSGLALRTDMTAQQQEYVEMIQSSSKTLLGIVNDILDFSKIEAGHMELEEVDLDLTQVLKDLSLIMVGRAAGKSIELVIDAPVTFPSGLRGDAVRLGQVLSNLATNAIKFTSEGEVVVAVEVMHTEWKMAEIRFEVRDTGIGIADTQFDNLFAPFMQADISTTRKFGGTGLGLPISRQLVRMMGGDIHVYSTEGNGSTFWFTISLPRSDDMAMALSDMAGPLDDLKAQSVLVVASNMTLRETLGRVMRPLCRKVMSVGNTKEAVAAVMRAALETGATPYQTIIVDERIDGGNGLDAIGKIGTSISAAGSPNFVMLVEHGFENSPVEVTGATPVRFLAKPVVPSELVKAVCGVAAPRIDRSAPDAGTAGAAQVGSDLALKGMKVLLVEDNAINRRIATDLLERQEVIVDVAENGRIGVQKAIAGGYDAVLMDLQMPEMDGLAATEEIRKDPSKAKLPIIALTANAQLSVRDECIAAGMNDHITKPIEPAILFQTLMHWRGRGDPQSAPPSVPVEAGQVPKAAGPKRESLKNLDGVDLEDLRRITGGDDGIIMELLRDFCGEYAGEADRIRNAWASGALEDAARMTHSLKGVSGNLRAMEVHGLATELEQVLRQDADDETVDHLIEDLSTALSAVDSALARHL